jgi:N-acetylmuramoyl-L-alanine amidase
MDRKLTGYTVVIDPGHGGNDPGAVDGINPAEGDTLVTKEADINFLLAQKLAHKIRMEGGKAVITRPMDKGETLANRCNIANKIGADVYIAMHANSATNAANGIETIYADGSVKGKLLATLIQAALVAATGARDRGVKPDTATPHKRLAVLRQTNMPAVLVEAGFISNVADERKLNEAGYQDLIATAVLRGIMAFRGAMVKK